MPLSDFESLRVNIRASRRTTKKLHDAGWRLGTSVGRVRLVGVPLDEAVEMIRDAAAADADGYERIEFDVYECDGHPYGRAVAKSARGTSAWILEFDTRPPRRKGTK